MIPPDGLTSVASSGSPHYFYHSPYDYKTIYKSHSPYDKGPNLTYCSHLGGVTVLYTNGSPGTWGSETTIRTTQQGNFMGA